MTPASLDLALSLIKGRDSDEPIEAWRLASECGYGGHRENLRRKARLLVAELRKDPAYKDRIGIGHLGGYYLIRTAEERAEWKASLRSHALAELHTQRQQIFDQDQARLFA